MSVRVVVDGWELGPAVRRRGMGRFLEQVLATLADHPALDVVVLRPADDRTVAHGCDPHLDAGVRRLVPRRRSRLGSVEHVLRLPRDLRRIDHDVAWSPGDLPLRRAHRPWVQTLHDVAPLLPGVPMDRVVRWRWRWLAGRLRDAERVVAVSSATADDAVRLLALDPRRIEVVHHGVAAEFHPGDPAVTAQRPRIVAVVSDDPRKGVGDLARVAARLAPVPLEVAGDLGHATRRRLTAAGAVVRGHVPDLPAFLRGGDVLVHTANHEGFGLVPLEAMACGTPVVAYDAGAVAEVVGDAARLVPVGAVDEMVGQVQLLLGSSAARAEHAEAGLRRAACFRWEDAGAAYARVLDEVC